MDKHTMKTFIFQTQWGWKSSGIALGLVFLLAVTLVKPIGVSTQFVIFDGIIWNAFSNIIVKNDNTKKDYTSTNAYLNKSGGKYAKNIANPLNYSFILVLSIILGGFIAEKLQNKLTDKQTLTISNAWRVSFGNSLLKRHFGAFIGGFLILFGSRLAGGCTSGHMISGIMQTSISGYLFALSAFAIALPVAFLIYKRR